MTLPGQFEDSLATTVCQRGMEKAASSFDGRPPLLSRFCSLSAINPGRLLAQVAAIHPDRFFLL